LHDVPCWVVKRCRDFSTGLVGCAGCYNLFLRLDIAAKA